MSLIEVGDQGEQMEKIYSYPQFSSYNQIMLHMFCVNIMWGSLIKMNKFIILEPRAIWSYLVPLVLITLWKIIANNIWGIVRDLQLNLKVHW